jgi:DDE superfamily endonuclease
MELPTIRAEGVAPCLVLPPFTSPLSPGTSCGAVVSSCANGQFRMASTSVPAWSWCCTNPPPCPTPPRPPGWTCIPTRFGSGGSAGRRVLSPWKTNPAGAARPLFPPTDCAVVKAIACEAVCQTQLPLSRLSSADLAARAHRALGKPISPSTVWRILDADALKPWRYEYWIFPRDPQFAEKAGRILDLYAGWWEGRRLSRGDCIISADEKTSIQARLRAHPTLPPAPGRVRRVEHEYERGGALQYLAGWDVQRGRVLGRCEATTGIAPFGRLVDQVMTQQPYCSAPRVFWVVDNGSSHRGQAAARRLRPAYPNAILVSTPVHASWLNQVEIYFSIIQRKVLTPNDFTSLAAVEERLRLYEELTNRESRPFAWEFDRAKLTHFLERWEAKRRAVEQALATATAEQHPVHG